MHDPNVLTAVLADHRRVTALPSVLSDRRAAPRRTATLDGRLPRVPGWVVRARRARAWDRALGRLALQV